MKVWTSKLLELKSGTYLKNCSRNSDRVVVGLLNFGKIKGFIGRKEKVISNLSRVFWKA